MEQGSGAVQYRRYWGFFWPLALNGLFLLIAQQAFNGVLARHDDPERELAVYAYALGIFFFFDIGTAFMPNLVTVYARSPAARRVVRDFCLCIGVAFMVPVLLLGVTAPGRLLVAAMFSIDGAVLEDVCAYLVLLSGLILLHVGHHYYNGLLILAEQTRRVSVIGICGVFIAIATALHGFREGWAPVYLLGAAEWFSGVFKIVALVLVWRGVRARLPAGDGPRPSYRELTAFFWPVCISGMTFGISRPLLFVFVARVPDAFAITAAMRVSMDFLMLYQAIVNQFRHFFAAFGLDDLERKRRFMTLVAALLTLAMALVLATPLSALFFETGLGLSAELHHRARFMGALLLVVPGVLMVRNYYHGILIVARRTQAMATGSFVRVLAIAGSGAGLLALGMLDYRTAALGMIAGFVAEMLIAWRSVLRYRRDTAG